MKKYDKYKDSGIEWIGQVPEHWEISRVKYILEQSKDGIKIGPFGSSLTGKVGEKLPYKVYGQWNIVGGDFTAGSNYVSEGTFQELSGYRVVPNDVLISMMGTVGKCAVIPFGIQEGIMDSHVVKIRIDNSKILSSFFQYIYDKDNSAVIINQIKRDRRGSIMDGLNSTIIKEFHLCIPPLSEQEAIAAYLDEKTGQIDALMAEKREQLKDLQTLRTSIITEAVTKGLNPNAPMKDSGIEWIGEIPEGWDYLPLKRIAFVQTGSTPSTEYEEFWNDGDFNWYTPSDFSDDSIFLESSNRKITNEAISHNAARCFPANTVMIVGIGATLGKVGISKNICSANQQINGIFFNERMLPLFGAYFLYSARQHIKSLSNSATLPIINQTATGEIKICIPPLSEQRAIAAYLDEKTSEIDAMKAELTAQIEDLKTLRTSLITEAVTGQVDVRDWKTKH